MSRFRFLLISFFILFAFLKIPVSAEVSEGSVVVLPAKGVVNPVLASYIERGITVAEQQRSPLIILELETPGGLDTSMRDIIKRIIASTVPVVVYVSPQGARAASAGAFITVAGHVAAMAPNTVIGAAHPVSGEGEDIGGDLRDKVTNDAVAYIRGIAAEKGRNVEWVEQAVRKSVSATAIEAKKLGVIDIVADDVPALLKAIDGRKVRLSTGTVTLVTKHLTVEKIEMTALERFLYTISDPNIAYLLMSLGTLAIMAELYNPGLILPGIVGVISLLLSAFSLGMLPINYAGLFLILFAIALFVAEAFVPSFGTLTIGGIIAMTLGSLMLINSNEPSLQISPYSIATVVITLTLFFSFMGGAALKIQFKQPQTGKELLIGQAAEVRQPLQPTGMVLLDGALWKARLLDGETAEIGERVRVVSIEGLELQTERINKSNG